MAQGLRKPKYRRARQRQMLCILYFKNEAAIPEEARESDTEQAARLVAFKKELSQSHIIAGLCGSSRTGITCGAGSATRHSRA